MSDTTAYLAGCATTGVAALVLLVARVGMVSATAGADSDARLSDRVAQIESAAPTQSANAQSEARSETALEAEIRKELEKQRDLTQQLEDQLEDQETLSSDLEEQLASQEEKTKDLLARIQDYQRSVEDMELEDKIAAAARPAAAPTNQGPSTSVIWVGAGLVVVLILGGGGLLLCSVLLILQAQRRSPRHMPMPMPRPMPPASGYRYYDPSFLPPSQYPPQRPVYYEYPPSPYDYTP
ncbi:MAG: hypothetical protein AAFQ63_18725 [Cyanobacteria bacterium J06621_11]